MKCARLGREGHSGASSSRIWNLTLSSIVAVFLLAMLVAIPFSSFGASGGGSNSTTIHQSSTTLSQSGNSTQVAPSNSSSGLNSIRIDESLFAATVPSYPTIGKNYTVRVLVTNTFSEQEPVIIELDGPVDFLQIHPLLFHSFALPRQQLIANFTIVAFNPSFVGQINLTATLWVWPPNAGGPLFVEQIGSVIYGAAPSLYAQSIVSILAGAAILAVVLVSVLYYLRMRRQSHQHLLP